MILKFNRYFFSVYFYWDEPTAVIYSKIERTCVVAHDKAMLHWVVLHKLV